MRKQAAHFSVRCSSADVAVFDAQINESTADKAQTLAGVA
jgi:hypothetical protein